MTDTIIKSKSAFPCAACLAALISILFFFHPSQGYAQSGQSILALVNDEPISALDVESRIKFKMASSGKEVVERLKARIQSEKTKEQFKQFMMENNPQSKEEADVLRDKFINKLKAQVMGELQPNMRKATLEELIEERLAIQEAKKQGLEVDDMEVNESVSRIAENNRDKETGKVPTPKEFLANLEKSGISARTFKERLRASSAIQKLIRQKYGLQLQNPLSEMQIDQKLASLEGAAKQEESTEFLLQKVTLIVSDNKDEKVKAKRLMDAEAVRKKFKSCKDTNDLLKEVGGGKVEPLGKVSSHQLPKDIKNDIVQAKAGEMTAPSITANGVEFYAICSKSSVKGNTQKREEIESETRQKQVEILKKRYLKEIRQNAFIEYK